MGQKETKKQQPEQSSADKMFDMIFEFKMMSKQFQKESLKATTQEKALYLKVKDAIEKGNVEGAKIFASDAIRKKNEAKRMQVLSSKIEAVHTRLQNAYQTNTVRVVNLIIS